MGADVLLNVGTIQEELEKAKNNLKGLNDNIRRIVGREPPDTQLRLDYCLVLFIFRFTLNLCKCC